MIEKDKGVRGRDQGRCKGPSGFFGEINYTNSNNARTKNEGTMMNYATIKQKPRRKAFNKTLMKKIMRETSI